MRNTRKRSRFDHLIKSMKSEWGNDSVAFMEESLSCNNRDGTLFRHMFILIQVSAWYDEYLDESLIQSERYSMEHRKTYDNRTEKREIEYWKKKRKIQGVKTSVKNVKFLHDVEKSKYNYVVLIIDKYGSWESDHFTYCGHSRDRGDLFQRAKTAFLASRSLFLS